MIMVFQNGQMVKDGGKVIAGAEEMAMAGVEEMVTAGEMEMVTAGAEEIVHTEIDRTPPILYIS